MVLIIIAGSIVAIFVIAYLILHQKKFGRFPRGERLERILRSPNYQNGHFVNLQMTSTMVSKKETMGTMIDFLFKKNRDLRPHNKIPVIKTDLHRLNSNENLFVWFGHSSYYMQIDGKRFLVDPVFFDASPFSFINKSFEGVNVYKPEDIPNIDYLIISHDHWDHLDYKTVSALKNRVNYVICGLGVGAHFEYWGFDKECIVEMDWSEKRSVEDEFWIHCLPCRHFSGRGLHSNSTLWASFIVQTPSQTIFVGGDGGYGMHFSQIGKQFPDIDLAILENGQYNKYWCNIHTMPEYLEQEVKDLNAKSVITVHHSKYALSTHPWYEPLENEKRMIDNKVNLIVPTIGEVVLMKRKEK